MTIEYYLSIREHYKQVINHLKELIDHYECIFSDCAHLDMDEGEQFLNVFEPKYYLEKYKSELNINNELKRLIDKKIKYICKHEFVSDLVDINPDKSIEVKYCVICQYTASN